MTRLLAMLDRLESGYWVAQAAAERIRRLMAEAERDEAQSAQRMAEARADREAAEVDRLQRECARLRWAANAPREGLRPWGPS